MIYDDRVYIPIPGSEPIELPPLLVRSARETSLQGILEIATKVVQDEELVPVVVQGKLRSEEDIERSRMDLAIQLAEQYARLLKHWYWGDSVIEWIRQCELTFQRWPELRALMRPDVWPHAGRRSFVELLEDKSVKPKDVDLESAVGLRLAFRQAPPLELFSDQFLIYLRNPVARTLYDQWANLVPPPVALLPPDRFEFEVIQMEI